MINRLDYSQLEPWLADDLHYDSQVVWDTIRCREEYAVYIAAKLNTIRRDQIPTFAEIGFGADYCVLVAQEDRDNLKGTLTIGLRDDKIIRMTMCVPPLKCERTGEYPA